MLYLLNKKKCSDILSERGFHEWWDFAAQVTSADSANNAQIQNSWCDYFWGIYQIPHFTNYNLTFHFLP